MTSALTLAALLSLLLTLGYSTGTEKKAQSLVTTEQQKIEAALNELQQSK